MPIRSTMADLNARVRLRIGDAAGLTQTFDEQAIQDALDDERIDFNISDWRELIPHYSPQSRQMVWTEYYDPSNWGDWEGDVALFDAGYNQLAPSVSEPLVGHWSFAPTSTPPPVFVVGKTYDVAAASRALCLRWIGLVAREFDFSVARGLQYSVSQKRAGLQQLADQLASEMRVRTAKLVRRDVYSAYGW